MAFVEIRPVILAVDDDPNMQESYKVLLEDKYNLFVAGTGKEATSILKKEAVDIVLLDIILPDANGIDLLKKIKETTDAEVIMVTAVKTVRTAIEAVKNGAYDYVTKPFDIDDLSENIKKLLEKQNLTKEIISLKAEIRPFVFESMVGKSVQMKKIFDLIKEVGKNQSTVLITGESGTGKELIARAIHSSSPRRDKPFIAVDCATIPEHLVESELFGHEKGSFTDATVQKTGRFELANFGTLFLDEIGNLPLDIQAKILRVIEERELVRVGGVKTIKIDVRILAATNMDLKKAVTEKKFREDLFYRLNVIPLFVPPLRERREDIILLINHFITVFNKEFGKNIKGIAKEAMELLINYNWPGNIRELRNIIERLVALQNEDVIAQDRLPLDMLLYKNEAPLEYTDKVSLKDARYEFEKQFILKVLEKTNWNQTKAAKLLGIHRNALVYKINMFKLKDFIRQIKSDTNRN
jgi:two-component system, NtrC family, response regulator AtoC